MGKVFDEGGARAAPTCAALIAAMAFASPLHAQAGPPAAAEREVTLDELIAYAAEHAPTLQVARAEEAGADAARAEAAPLLHENPVLEIGVGPRFMPGDTVGVDVVAAFAQPIEIAGERGARQRSARRLAERLQAATDVAELDLRHALALGYAEAALARQRLALAEQLTRFAGEVLAVTQRQLAAGDANLIELRTAEADAASAAQERILAEQALTTARLELCETSGWPIATPPLPKAQRPELTPLPALDPLLRAARVGHAELRQEDSALALAEAETDLAEREAAPAPAIGVAFARESAVLTQADYVVLGTIALPLPLFQHNQAARAKAQAEAGVARARKEALTAALRVRIARAHAELRAAQARVALFEATIGPSLDESLGLLERGFVAGEIPLLDVLAARERLLYGKRAALDAYGDYARARFELERALGAPLPAIRTPQPGGSP